MSDRQLFRPGDAIVVKPGVMCPDMPALSLAGWQGWVTEVHASEGTVQFTWDSAFALFPMTISVIVKLRVWDGKLWD